MTAHDSGDAKNWSEALATAIARERRRAQVVADTHRLNVENLGTALARDLDTILNWMPHASLAHPDALPAARQRPAPLVAELPSDDLPGEVLPGHASPGPASPGSIEPVGEPKPAEVRPRKNSTADRAAAFRELVAPAMDWESQKRRMIASLEAESNTETDRDPARQDERLSLEGMIHITDEIIADKDREIGTLQTALKLRAVVDTNQVAADMARSEAVLQADAIVVQERERLKHEMIALDEARRLSEIELSRERAKLARERADLEEKLRALQDDRLRFDKDGAGDGSKPSGVSKGPRGRWLQRLGLKDEGGDG